MALTELQKAERRGFIGGSLRADPMATIKRLPHRVLKKIKLPESEDSCWEWLAWKREGYGLLKVGKSSEGAHRIIYRAAFGDIPRDLEVDHLCRNHSCVNPNHLDAIP